MYEQNCINFTSEKMGQKSQTACYGQRTTVKSKAEKKS